MEGVIVDFEYGDGFDAARVATIAHEARDRFLDLPGLRQTTASRR